MSKEDLTKMECGGCGTRFYVSTLVADKTKLCPICLSEAFYNRGRRLIVRTKRKE